MGKLANTQIGEMLPAVKEKLITAGLLKTRGASPQKCAMRVCKYLGVPLLRQRKGDWVVLFQKFLASTAGPSTLPRGSRVPSKEFVESREWLQLRYEVLSKYGRVCMCCGAKGAGVIIQVDHIKPRSKYPELAFEIDNLQVLCKPCNQGKGAWDETDWRRSA